ncbi:heme oxygenase [Actinoplanes octamycinicus]|uniref:Heme oxygenase n=1 Tax=Actinoplanes octamycinicus TaxID=135948 RepID=A0A7W7M6D1_9ACTN|nr:biliverdin-producing heme oxygenase [Actinoplanes octamycinicus]MBB4738679.1 heme oxygenase [Actinoplanes octamycinicus]GIE61412.1 heme oxygenase [Actinoplanes octamycinicus]
MTGFAARLRRATMAGHRDAETRGFVTRLLGGAVPPAGFAALTAQYLFIYRELESAATAMLEDPVAGGFADPALARVAALESDLAHLYGPDWPSAAEPIEATRAYTARLRERCSTSPAHFVAHHYVRYLGDLSGGQLVGSRVATVYGLGRAGTAFYRFDRIPDPKVYKAAYRARLDALALPPTELDTLVAEARHAFALNAAVFQELGTTYPGDLVPAA